MDALEFLKIAKKLINGGEANWRTSISRSYYAVFNHLKKECITLGIAIPKSSKGHNDLSSNFYNSGVQDAVDIGARINDLYSQRLTADYELHCIVTKQTADLMLRKAEGIIAKYPAIDKTAFKAGIEKYKSAVTNARSASS